MTPAAAVEFLEECARYFERRPPVTEKAARLAYECADAALAYRSAHPQKRTAA